MKIRDRIKEIVSKFKIKGKVRTITKKEMVASTKHILKNE